MRWISCLSAVFVLAGAGAVHGQDGAGGEADLGAQLANPVSSLTSIPIQYNYDEGYGPLDGHKHFINVQPVIPFDIGGGSNLVVRTILPVVADQIDVGLIPGSVSGLSDTLQSFFFVPPSRDTALGTFTAGFGPAVTWPTSTDAALGLGSWGLGPTGVFLFQEKVPGGTFTWGTLAGHQWAIGETRERAPYLNNTFFQPFMSLTTPDQWTYTVNIEGNYDWTSEEAGVPVNFMVAKLTDIGGQKIQFQIGARYWLDSPDSGPDGWGARAAMTFLFPK